jgi:hypothetical protein
MDIAITEVYFLPDCQYPAPFLYAKRERNECISSPNSEWRPFNWDFAFHDQVSIREERIGAAIWTLSQIECGKHKNFSPPPPPTSIPNCVPRRPNQNECGTAAADSMAE